MFDATWLVEGGKFCQLNLEWLVLIIITCVMACVWLCPNISLIKALKRIADLKLPSDKK